MKALILIWTLLLPYLAFGQATAPDLQYVVSTNMLVNPSFEQGKRGWVNTNGVFTITTASGEFSEYKSAAKIALTAQVLSFSQSVSTPSGVQKQGYVRALYRVPSTMADFQICSLVDGVEQTCVPTASLNKTDIFSNVDIPIIFGATSAGIKFKTTASYTANAYFDGVVVAQGRINTSIQLDNVYSLTSNAGSISLLNKAGWVTSCTSSSTSVCTFATGLFTQVPNCTVTTDNALTTVQGAQITSVSTSSVSVTQVAQASGTPVNGKFFLICQKTGADYQSADAYIASNSNTNLAAYTPTITSSGAITLVDIKYQRRGDFLKVIGTFTSGASATAITISLPTGLVIDSGKISTSNYQTVGHGSISSVGFYNLTILAQGGLSTVTLGLAQPATSPNVPYTGWAAEKFQFNFEVPIQGWTNSNLIVASLAGTPNVPGLTTAVDTFSVNYGTTNATTSCTASPCSYLDQIGTTPVTSVTRSGTGVYTLNTARTYTKLKCSLTASHAVQGGLTPYQSSMSCANCSAITFNTTNTVGFFDSFGLLMCQGAY